MKQNHQVDSILKVAESIRRYEKTKINEHSQLNFTIPSESKASLFAGSHCFATKGGWEINCVHAGLDLKNRFPLNLT